MNATLKTVYFLGMLAEVLIRIPHERRRRRTRIAVERVDGLERGLVSLMSVGMLFVPTAHALTPWLDWADYRLSPRARGLVGGLGAAILACAVWLFWRAHVDLGRNWSPSLQLREGHALVTRGVYRSVRHPMYTSQWLWGVGQALLLQNWVAGWAGLALFAPLYFLRVPREERMMLDRFGEEFCAYMDRTGRVVPYLS